MGMGNRIEVALRASISCIWVELRLGCGEAGLQAVDLDLHRPPHNRDTGRRVRSIAYAILPTISFSLHLYSAELYPTRLRAVGTCFDSDWLRAGSAIGPLLVGWIVDNFGISYVFTVFAAAALIGGHIIIVFAVETKGRVLEELST